ncbi:MAG: hypothetical protein ABIU05_04290 [Nitrospirales bacterium]
MASPICVFTEDRISKIRNQMQSISHSSTFYYPRPITGENWDKQQQVVEALYQARLAWDLATIIINPGMPPDLSVPGRLTSELADTVYRYMRFEGQFPARGENTDVDALLDLAERALDRALTALRLVPRASDGRLIYATP